MLSIGDAVQPGALGASYGMGPYTVVPGGAGAAPPAGLSVPAMPGGASSLSNAAAPLSGSGGGMPAASVPSLATSAPSSLTSSVLGGTPSSAIPSGFSSASPAAPTLGAGAVPQPSFATAMPSGALPSAEMQGMPTALPPGVGDTAGGPTVAQAVSDLDPTGYPSSPPMPIGAQAAGQAAPVVPGQPGELPVGQPSALIPDAPIPQNPIGEDPDSYQAVMAILKGSPLT